MRYLSKQFETEICKSYRPFLNQEWEKERSSELFCVNYGKAEVSTQEKDIRRIASLAAQLGKSKMAAEVPSIDTERIAKYYFANGVNRICFQEKPDERVLEYFMRLGYFLGEGSQDINVAIFEPDEEDCRLFSKHGIPYHILTNIGMMKYGFVDGDKIGCGRCAYEFLVLPSAVRLEPMTEQIVRQFAKQGGKVLLLGDRPMCKGKPAIALNEGTCTFGQIAGAQIYRNKNTDTEIYTTYRSINEMQLLYVVNASIKREYEQTFDFGKQVNSFLKLDLLELTAEQVPLTIKLGPAEDAVLLPYARKIEE